MYVFCLKVSQCDEVEVVKHNSDPAFSRPFRLQKAHLNFQQVKVSVYEKPSSSTKKSEEKFLLGEVVFDLQKLKDNNSLSSRLMTPDGSFARAATITIFTEDVSKIHTSHLFKFSATGLDDKDTLSLSDPYLEVHKRLKNNVWEILHRTEVIVNTLSPEWKPFAISTQSIINHNFANELKFVITDYDDDGKHDFIGESVVSLEQLLNASEKMNWQCINQHKKYRKGETYTDSGTLTMELFKVTGIQEKGEMTKL
ncbi:Potassium channel, variant 2 [Chamberlinius hualienensis]